jgi:hypothetical protein
MVAGMRRRSFLGLLRKPLARRACFIYGQLAQLHRIAILGVMLPWMQLSFLFDCDDVALPALKLDPDAELACVVPADVEVR